MAAGWVAAAKTRVELVSVELEEQRAWLEHLVLLGVGLIFCASFGLILLTFFVVVLFWDTDHRRLVLGGLSALYLGGACWLGFKLRQKMRARPKLFSATAAELRKDHEALEGRNR